MAAVKDKIKLFSRKTFKIGNDKEKNLPQKRRFLELCKRITFADPKLDYNLNSATPQFCIQLLKFPHQKYFLKLRNKIRVSDQNWLDEFIKLNGLYELLKCIELLCKKKSNITNSIRLSICISCIKEIMNLEHGIDAVLIHCLENPSYGTIFGNVCMTPCQTVKQNIFEFLSVICHEGLEGHQFCLKILEIIKKEKKMPHKFSFLLNEIRENMNYPFYIATILVWLNLLIIENEDLRERMNARAELSNLRFQILYDEIKKIQNPDLLIQLSLYTEWQLKDETEALTNNGIDLNNSHDLFNAICLKTQQSVEYHQNFVEVLQMIFLADEDDDGVKLNKDKLDKIWNNIVEATKKITNNLKNQVIDIETQTDDQFKNELNSLENILILKNNSTTQTDESPLPLPAISNEQGTNTNCVNSKVTLNISETSPPAPTAPINSSAPPPPPPPFPVLNSTNQPPHPPPPPPFPLSSSNNSMSPPSFPGPPPPPPPPPFSGVNSTNSLNAQVFPPPLQLGNAVSIVSAIVNISNPIYSNLPKAPKSVKSVNWQKLAETSIKSDNNIWKKINSENAPESIDYRVLEKLFSKPASPTETRQINDLILTKIPENSNFTSLPVFANKEQSLQCLDQKKAMSINIYLRQIKSPINDFIQLLIEGKHKVIGVDNLNCLKKILPEKSEVDQINLFCESNAGINKLEKAEKFIKLLSDIPNYNLRINTMLYLEEYNELYKKVAEPIKITNKCAEVLYKDKSLKTFLKLVLTMGNYLNSNSYNGKAVGFRVSILPKLIDFKSIDSSTSLLHVIIDAYKQETTNNEFEFIENLKDLQNALKTSLIKSEFNQLKSNTTKTYNQVNSPNTEEDIKDQHLKSVEICNAEVLELENEINKMISNEKELAEYYSEDITTFTLDEFFQIFRDLCSNITKILDETKAKVLNEEKVSRRKKELETQKLYGTLNRHSKLFNNPDGTYASNISDLKMGNFKPNRMSIKLQKK